MEKINKVVITGVGAVSAIGSNYAQIIDGIKNGNTGIDIIQNYTLKDFPFLIGAEVKGNRLSLDENPGVDRKELFLNKAIDELFKNNPSIDEFRDEERILNLGIGIDFFDKNNHLLKDDYKSETWQANSSGTYDLVGRLTKRFFINGGFNINVAGSVAASHAIGLSYRMLQYFNDWKMIIAGGADSMFNSNHYLGFHKLGSLADWKGNPSEACRPFDKKRCGIVLGEGAAVFSIQNEKDTDPKNILAEIVGYSSTIDSSLGIQPESDGKMLAKAALQAITDACITPKDIDCVHMHGTGTYKNEISEANALKIVFGDRYTKIPVFSFKPQVGHLVAACGAIEMVGVLYSILTQSVPPTINYEFPDPDVPLNVIKDKPLQTNIKYVLKLNSAFGGQNTAFIIKRYD
jgi:3-oxoacyl-[acyl-carrier-protein] synthase II